MAKSKKKKNKPVKASQKQSGTQSGGGRKKSTIVALALILGLPIAFLIANAMNPRSAAKDYSYRVVNKLPHDPNAFTQGFIYHDNFFFESTGLRGESTLRKLSSETGNTVQRHDLHEDLFAEGLTLWGDKLYQITYTSGIGFVYNARTFAVEKEFKFEGQGWGLTHDDDHLIMTNGGDKLYFRNPETFEIEREVTVRDGSRTIRQINELEYINGEIWANIWQTKRIVVIDPKSGRVTKRIDMRGLPHKEDINGNEDYLNGIAYDAEQDRIFVTGKLYSKIYQIELVEKDS